MIRLHVLGALSWVGWLTLALLSRDPGRHLTVYLGVSAWAWLTFVLAWSLCRSPQHPRLRLPLVIWSVAFRLAGFFATPVLEDDYWRLLWDGRQFALTGNPYATAPAAHFADPKVPDPFLDILDHLNYPHVPTIYGPVCQAGFLLSYWIAPGRLWPWKLMVIGADLAAIFLIHELAKKRSPAGPQEKTEAWASTVIPLLVAGWCPLAVFETSFNAHPDELGVALLLAAWLCWQRKALTTGAILGALAVAAKPFALFLVPFLLGRRWRVWGWFALTLGGCYAPFWLQGSGADWTGLKAFASEWEFNSSAYALAKMFLGPVQGRLACGVVFAVFWCLLLGNWLRHHQDIRGEWVPPGTILFGVLLLLSTTVNPWYLLWMLPFVALRSSCAGLAALALVSLSYVTALNIGDPNNGSFEHPVWVRLVEYGGLSLALAGEAWQRKRKGGPQKGCCSRSDTIDLHRDGTYDSQ